MADYEPYQVIDENRIIPIRRKGWVKNQPKVQNFKAALQKLLTPVGLEDAGLIDNDDEWDKRVKRNLPYIYSAYYIDPEEALFVLTGIMPDYAFYLFYWEDSVYILCDPTLGYAA